jgi:DNA polymerase III delta prime subunit
MPKILSETPERVNLWPGLERCADRVARLVEVLPASSPVLLSGDWGSGKTTALLALERALGEGEGARPTVWFDAWRYEAQPGLLSALIRTVWASAPAAYRGREDAKTLFGELWRLAVVVGSRVVPALVTAAGAPFVGAALKELTAAALMKDVETVSGAAELPEADPTSLLWERFAALVGEAWGGVAPIILVDDLDRCNPDNAVALLDGIRLLVTGGVELKCNFVVALDRGVIAGAISRKFAGIGGYDGNRYLEKIFPFGFSVPAPYDGDAADLVNQLLEATQAKGHHPNALRTALRHPLFANPRLMKRCINRFLLVTYFESTVPSAAPARPADEAQLERDRALATWIAATERWPALRALLGRHDEAYWTALEAAIAPWGAPGAGEVVGALAALGPEAAAVLTEQSLLPWLRKEMFGKEEQIKLYREAEQRIRRWGA